jgi:hypothetical protein
MATKSLLKNANDLVRIIQREKTIHKFDLMDKASMSMSQYDKLAPYLKHRFAHLVEYDRNSKHWKSLKVTDIESGDQVLI